MRSIVRCPNCFAQVRFQKELFRGLCCKECNSAMLVSDTYSRILVVLALFLAEALLWVCDVRTLFYPTLGVPFGVLASFSLGFPVGFLLLTVMVRTVPHLVPPPLVIRHSSTVTTLGLSRDRETTAGSES